MWTPNEVLNLLWNQLWQVTLVAVLVSLVSVLLRARRWHPSIANSLWLLVLAKALTPPLWASPTGVFSWASAQPAGPFAGIDADVSSGTLSSAGSFSATLTTILLAIWVVGFVGTLTHHLLQWRRLQLLIQSSRLPNNPTLIKQVSELSKQLGFRNAPPVAVTRVELGPALAGIWRPEIILPASLVEKASWQEIEPIVAHELLHLRRRDTTVSALQLFANAIWWFHPLVRWAGKQVEEASERCVDLEVLHVAGCDAADYCRSLVRVLESRCRKTHCLLLATPGVRGVSVTCERIRELADVPQRPGWWQRASGLLLVGCLGLVLLPGKPLASLQATCSPAICHYSSDTDELTITVSEHK